MYRKLKPEKFLFEISHSFDSLVVEEFIMQLRAGAPAGDFTILWVFGKLEKVLLQSVKVES